MTEYKPGTIVDTYYGKECLLCGSPVNGKNDSMYGGACKECKAQEQLYKQLTTPDYLGTQICPVDGFEKEIALCLDTKARAILRHKLDRPYTMSQCRKCGSSVDMMPVREFYTPEQEAHNNKNANCGNCGILFEKKNGGQIYCSTCSPKMKYQKQNKRRAMAKGNIVGVEVKCASCDTMIVKRSHNHTNCGVCAIAKTKAYKAKRKGR